MRPVFDVVIPTVGRPSLGRLLEDLANQEEQLPGEVVIVDDRPHPGDQLPGDLPSTVLRSGGSGPAAARNLGWRSTRAPFVAFVDDDVRLPRRWTAELKADLESLPEKAAGSQGRIHVPLPPGRPPTDWERNVAGLEGASYVTADMAFRRSALEECGGFDEAFPRAFREDSDIALRLMAEGWEMAQGQRRAEHPVPPADAWVSLRLQANNAADAMMRARFGRGWRRLAAAGGGRRMALHILTTAAAAAFLLSVLTRGGALRRAAALCWLGLTAEFAWERIAPGPFVAEEIVKMLVTSALIPPFACYHRGRGELALVCDRLAAKGRR